jgi:predicted enzyme related to lactoylglutathione lyase
VKVTGLAAVHGGEASPPSARTGSMLHSPGYDRVYATSTRLPRFWTQALGWQVLSERENEIVIGTDENAPVGICFMPVSGPKTVKNRVHLDLTSSAEDRDQEIDRLLALGAQRVDIGQTGAESWIVLADPEGNEFCVVRPKETLIS